MGVRLLYNGSNKLDVINNSDIDGEWYMNVVIELAYLPACPPESLPYDTNKVIDDDNIIGTKVGDDIWWTMDTLTLL